MLASKLARTSIIFNNKSAPLKIYNLAYRELTSQAKEGFARRSFKTKNASGITQSSSLGISATPLNIGRGVVAGASALGLGALAYYGLGFSNASGFADSYSLWPDYIRERVHTTYKYFGASLGATAASAYAISRSPTLMRLAMGNSMIAVFASIALMMGSGFLVRSIPYESTGPKHLAWLLHAGLIGGFVAPLTLLGGQLLTRAAIYTAGIVGGLSTVAATAPSDKFLNMGLPLGIGLGFVFAASLAGMFFPPTTRLGLSLYSISVYGGLVLFSGLMLYDTQKIVKKAETHNYYDPINESVSIYLDTINIFVRIAMILANGGSKRK